MADIAPLIQRVLKTAHGFTDIQRASEEVFTSQSAAEVAGTARELFACEVPQARMLATFLFGRLAAASKETLGFLRGQVSRDPDWRVQEILAQAFDRYCRDTGYETALPVIKDWLLDPNPNVRRAVTEGLRIWTSRPYFRERPEIATSLLSQLRADQSEYVRKAVGNALRDISRKHGELVGTELQGWDLTDKRVSQTPRLASRFLA